MLLMEKVFHGMFFSYAQCLIITVYRVLDKLLHENVRCMLTNDNERHSSSSREALTSFMTLNIQSVCTIEWYWFT